MWLEEFAWFWLPAGCGVGLWVMWRRVALKAEVRMLHARVERLEDEEAARGRAQHRVA